MKDQIMERPTPETVALVAMGASRSDFISEAMKAGGTTGIADEVWVINKLGDVLKHDLCFRMDDMMKPRRTNLVVRNDKDGITVHERQTEWMKNHDKPIVTTTAYPEFPTSITYPIEGVVNTIGYSYFLTTPAYAAAFAIHIGVQHLKLYGCDYVYLDNAYQSEAGRGNIEFILGVGMMKGMKVTVAKNSTLLAANLPIDRQFYGYEHIIEVMESDEPGQTYKLVHRHDLTKKREEENKKRELEILKELKVKHEGATIDYETGDLVTETKKPKPKPKKKVRPKKK